MLLRLPRRSLASLQTIRTSLSLSASPVWSPIAPQPQTLFGVRTFASKTKKKLNRANSTKGIRNAKYAAAAKVRRKAAVALGGAIQSGESEDAQAGQLYDSLHGAASTGDGTIASARPMKELSLEDIMLPPPPETIHDRIALDPFENLYTLENDATNHTEEDIGRYYHFMKDKQHHKVPSILVKGTPLYDELVDTGGYMMVREEAYKLVQTLKDPDASLGKTIGVFGRKGCGKSAALVYAAQHAREAGHIVLATSAPEFMHEKVGFLEIPSGLNKKNYEDLVFGQPRYAAIWLGKMSDENEVTFKQVTLKGDYSYVQDKKPASTLAAEQVEDVEIPTTLYDLCQIVRKDYTIATRVLSDVETELRSLTEDEPRLTVIVDKYNQWDERSEFYEPIKVRRIWSRQLDLVRFMDSLLMTPPARGTGLFANGRDGTQRGMAKWERYAHKKFYIEKYTETEFINVIYHYEMSRIITKRRPDLNAQYFGKIKVITAGIPRETYDWCILV